MFINMKERKYLTENEVLRFLGAVKSGGDSHFYIFCRTMADTGCRISEALSLDSNSIDTECSCIRIESLKKRRKGVYRTIPVSYKLIDEIIKTHSKNRSGKYSIELIWTYSRMTAYRRIVNAMKIAGIHGRRACPKGLRHGFAVRALTAGVPLTLVQRWLGHSDIKTTGVYLDIVGAEERSMAERMWIRPGARTSKQSQQVPSRRTKGRGIEPRA